MEFGINSFGLNDVFVNDFQGTLKRLKEIGFRYIEPNVMFQSGLPMSKEDVYRGLKAKKMDGRFWCEFNFENNYNTAKEYGLEVIGCQITLSAPCDAVTISDDAVALAKKFGLKYIVYNPAKRGLKEGETFVGVLKTLCAKLKENGIELLIHNHPEELIERNGTCLFDELLSAVPDLKVELDVGWVRYVKLDVLSTINKYRDRIRVLHLKDILDTEEKIFPAIGEGIIPLEDIINASKKLDLMECGLIFDQDDSADILADTAKGMANVKKYL